MLPLKGLRILAFETWGSGPYGSMMLADLGAEVIKVENPSVGGDTLRGAPPYYLDEKKTDSEFFESVNRNKKSITLNLKNPDSKPILEKLIKNADATLDNMRGDVPAKIGLDYESLKKYNPKIVCVHCSAYGSVGPRKSWPGYDFLMQAETGWMSVTGEPDGPPVRLGISAIDIMSGVYAALGLLAGVYSARETGVGRDISTNLFDVALSTLTYPGVWELNEGVVAKRLPRSAHAEATPCQVYKTKDGWIYIACILPKFWEILCDLLNKKELLTDPRFDSGENRLKNRDELTKVLDGIFEKQISKEWLELLNGKVPCAPVNDIAEAMNSPYVKENEKILSIPYPGRGDAKLIASPFYLPNEEMPKHLAPKLGESNESILSSLGYSPEEIKAFQEKGVI